MVTGMYMVLAIFCFASPKIALSSKLISDLVAPYELPTRPQHDENRDESSVDRATTFDDDISPQTDFNLNQSPQTEEPSSPKFDINPNFGAVIRSEAVSNSPNVESHNGNIFPFISRPSGASNVQPIYDDIPYIYNNPRSRDTSPIITYRPKEKSDTPDVNPNFGPTIGLNEQQNEFSPGWVVEPIPKHKETSAGKVDDVESYWNSDFSRYFRHHPRNNVPSTEGTVRPFAHGGATELEIKRNVNEVVKQIVELIKNRKVAESEIWKKLFNDLKF